MLQEVTVASCPFCCRNDHQKGWNKFCIYSLIQLFEMSSDVRNSPSCVYDFIFKTTNKRTRCCSWFYRSCFTQNFKLVNPFCNFFFHLGIFKSLCTNCPFKVSVPFIGDLNLGSRKYLSCS